MKKILSLALLTIIGLTAVSCNEKPANGGSNPAVDSLSLEIGTIYGNGFAQGMKQQDSTINLKEVIRAIETVTKTDTANHGYLNGLQAGMQLMSMFQGMKAQYGIDINQKIFMNAFKKAFLGDSLLSQEQLMERQAGLESLISKAVAEVKKNDPEAIKNQKAGEAFLNKKAGEPGYKKTKSGLVYKVITEGKGENFKEQDEILVNYRGTHIDGKEFDKSAEPVAFRMSGTVPGFAEMLKLMKPGMKVEVIIPAELAYGAEGSRNPMSGEVVIGPNETLVFEMEAVGVKPAENKPAQPAQPVKPAK